ncbi:JmjC-domain-containing protein [Daedalea quercina L-15889]|uniref:[histone H3]-trimethyl-L-lysine(9) demethylase n=1 Tax=Daedalea quercina L-15889 TaxID=1314783 RepID=A0A165NYK7_9APHY|nr:JmjC-domain-containing protein [Daedalea quercina L-15889]
MSSASGHTPSLTPASSRDSTPEPPVQPDHFYGSDNVHLPPSPHSDGRPWLSPEDDPWAQRGIPVFKPTLEEFRDFEAYLNRIECWGMKSGIVKVIPPKEWTDSLPPLTEPLSQVRLKNPIEQHMFGHGGLFRQENVEKRRAMSVREWAELCSKEELRAPGVDDVGLHARAANASASTRSRTRRTRKKRESETAEPDPEAHAIKEEEEEVMDYVPDAVGQSLASPPNSTTGPSTPVADEARPAEDEASVIHIDVPGATGPSPDEAPGEQVAEEVVAHEGKEAGVKQEEEEEGVNKQPKAKRKRATQSRQAREASLAERAAKDKSFLESFDPHSDWLPPNTTPFDYTPEFCRELERRYWRNCGLGKPAWYGADMQGSLFTDETKDWNVGHLESALSRLLPSSSKGLPGVNTPYLYFGMWRATFAWHVEDMDLFSINYVHFGAPKYWYAIPQAKAPTLETAMRGYFPRDVSNCKQFLRHKSFLASPHLLSQSSCRPNSLVQRAGEFVITFPMGYHAGFNLGFNCAESVNFALDSWIEIGRKAKACACVNFSVRINVDQLLHDREAERLQVAHTKPRKSDTQPKSEKGARAKSAPLKRKAAGEDNPNPPKKHKPSGIKTKKSDNRSADATASTSVPTKVTLKLPPKPKEPDVFPCCLCVSMSQENLLRVHDPPLWQKEGEGGSSVGMNNAVWMAHEICANVIPETWVDDVEVGEPMVDGSRAKERVVYGVDAIVKDRWNLKCSACSKTRYKAHGAPIQCTKGKCPKAFHVSCARGGSDHNIVYKELREVEKEVILLDFAHQPTGVEALAGTQVVTDAAVGQLMPAEIDPSRQVTPALTVPGTEQPEPRVLKLVRKIEVQVLCSQHNPAVAEAKRAVKQEKIRNDLLALPPMSRIKLRVSAGLFEVSLVRVIEESCSVEVLWDRGLKREFKWGSVVFGNVEGVTIGQKPSEPAPEPHPSTTSFSQPRFRFAPLSSTVPTIECRPTRMPVPATPPPQPFSASPAAAAALPRPPTTQQHPVPPPQAYSAAANYQYATTNWRYHYPQVQPHYVPQAQNYSYSNPANQPHSNTTSYESYSTHTPAQTSTRGLQWQRPYTGPKNMHLPPNSASLSDPTAPYYAYPPASISQNGGAVNQWPTAYNPPGPPPLGLPAQEPANTAPATAAPTYASQST